MQKKLQQINVEVFKKKAMTYSPTIMAVPSALIGLTSLFGMGRGEPYRYNHLKFLVDFTGVIQVLSTATLVAIS